MKKMVNLSRIHFPVTTLGPGRRIGIWFQGCSIRCPGCISMDTWVHGRGTTVVEAVVEAVSPWLSIADGITISGGEPFDQREALFDLLTGLRTRTDADILVFTGYSWPTICDALAASPSLIDAIVSGPFEIEEAQTMALRGSDNQELHLLTPLGRARFESFDRPIGEKDRAFDVMFDDNGDVWLAGIPARGDFRRLQHMLEGSGSTLGISEDTRFPSL
ncbi:anaerobic ribonucleoside-triphosphate reductase activating protein [Bradyrhizobium japonicum]|jgi:anaerobic ribonucleoside-triphosphate reductase activating protein|uniref:4Fe-4S cluster-binding domain-containing protein n=1 Tax=Bradyrhizobium TaxID=374 RepID=UPI00037CD22B|nr:MULTISPECIES: 4Fe-4S cluster-binding domain-containing protein [Bradyrhizobium]MCP1728859.1 anaerobic ribonucleoside-triphosphate reductase activating protein [Bradyrhizobium elkanii]MCS3452343.1 anaerobic ribonucleoside-triphosphate reductase activating protein [Bradyrhizobium elkanii]MCS3565554.1 anaerobic ribonucleoside-triphosphate reductase activating protein [Bradyrhizobium elkanii]MCS3572983.1 anaerobic ribonucleoside-triphosphate reductase activating protein [Bradyrhizobium elkanii]